VRGPDPVPILVSNGAVEPQAPGRSRGRPAFGARPAALAATPRQPPGPALRLTLVRAASYDPPDDERADCAHGRRRRVCVPPGVELHESRGRTERITDSPDGQADISAQEATSRQGARLPCPDEDVRGAPHPGHPPGPRSEAPHGLTEEPGTVSPRLVMLSRPQDFAALQGKGTLRSHPLLTARFLRNDLETTRFGLSTGRKLGGAVVRNRARRRIREALRVMAPSFQPGWDVLIIARPALVEADHEALVGALRRLLERGGVIGGPATR
jgi:ribonuclease P protein component